MDRAQMLERLGDTEPFDLAVIGGGATGLGAAVDAASRGHRVVLFEQDDFAKGTSSRSTKLVHGGVRYLKQGDVSLVLEALRERGLLCRNAPHLVHSLPFVIPNYHWWEGPFYGVGLKVYDALAGELGLDPSRYLSREDMLALLPTLEPEGLNGGIVYHDGQFDDARLAIHLAMTAVDHGAVVLNHVACTGLMREKDQIIGLLAQDAETGRGFEVRARGVINATGVFVDAVRRMDDREARSLVSPSQGVHLVLPREFLPGDSAIMIPKTDDGRVLFAVPWHERVIVGTTDTAMEHADLEPRALDEEIEFLLTHAARYLTRDPEPSDVLSVFAGLRPLVAAPDAESTASISRDHVIEVSPAGLITITGGKWTTYRRMAEEVIDHAEMVAGIGTRRCVTHDLRVHGACDPIQGSLSVYGSDATSIQALMDGDKTLRSPVHSDLTLTGAEVLWHVRAEMARSIEDVLARRSRSLLLNARASADAATRVAELMASELGWDEHRVAREAAAFAELAQGYLLP
jgi:glycerol-3-phosphate dehydrogenase